jgi:hypothetical protein
VSMIDLSCRISGDIFVEGSDIELAALEKFASRRRFAFWIAPF